MAANYMYLERAVPAGSVLPIFLLEYWMYFGAPLKKLRSQPPLRRAGGYIVIHNYQTVDFVSLHPCEPPPLSHRARRERRDSHERDHRGGDSHL